MVFNGGLALVHAACEVAVVSPFFMAGYMFKPEQLETGYLMSVLVLVGGGTLLHSLIRLQYRRCFMEARARGYA